MYNRSVNYVDAAFSFFTSLRLWRGEKPPPPGAGPLSVQRILILGYAAIGDLIFLLPVLELLRKHYPEAKITFIANRYPTSEELLPATGLVDDIWFVEWEGPQALWARAAVNRRIREARFDLALLSLSSPAHYFQKGLASVPRRIGHCRPWPGFRRALITGEVARRALLNGVAWVSPQPEHALKRNLRLLTPLGIAGPASWPKPKLPLTENQRAFAQARLGPKTVEKLIAVHVGAPNNQYGKMWEPARFGELCARLAKRRRARFVLVGGMGEKAAAQQARNAFPEMLSLAGECSLLETFAVIEKCDLFLGNDTGLAKAAMLLGVPTATWWGPSDPAEYGVIWDPEKHLDIRTGIGCSPCSRMGMPNQGVLNYTFCGHHDCLKKLDVDFALAALLEKYEQYR